MALLEKIEKEGLNKNTDDIRQAVIGCEDDLRRLLETEGNSLVVRLEGIMKLPIQNEQQLLLLCANRIELKLWAENRMTVFNKIILMARQAINRRKTEERKKRTRQDMKQVGAFFEAAYSSF